MKRICAWCGRGLDQVEHRENQPLTHGLCADCRRRFFAVSKDPESSPVGNDEGETPTAPPSSGRK